MPIAAINWHGRKKTYYKQEGEMNRKQIAEDLMRDCPDELEPDHQEIADAILRGDTWAEILDMEETNAWPDTYVWLKTQIEIEEGYAMKTDGIRGNVINNVEEG
jgi:hypothetical protein